MASTRERIITATAELFRRQGYNGTSLKQVTVAAGAPFGSLYHGFPGGKEELAEAVIETSGAAYRTLFEVIADAAPDIVAGVGDFFDGAAIVLEETGYVDACPIGTVALEVASTNDRLRRATERVFAGWVEAATERLRAAGLADDEADDLAQLFVAAIEGGFMLSRAARSPEPMRAAGRQVRRLVAASVAAAAASASAGQPAGRAAQAANGASAPGTGT